MAMTEPCRAFKSIDFVCWNNLGKTVLERYSGDLGVKLCSALAANSLMAVSQWSIFLLTRWSIKP